MPGLLNEPSYGGKVAFGTSGGTSSSGNSSVITSTTVAENQAATYLVNTLMDLAKNVPTYKYPNQTLLAAMIARAKYYVQQGYNYKNAADKAIADAQSGIEFKNVTETNATLKEPSYSGTITVSGRGTTSETTSPEITDILTSDASAGRPTGTTSSGTQQTQSMTLPSTGGLIGGGGTQLKPPKSSDGSGSGTGGGKTPSTPTTPLTTPKTQTKKQSSTPLVIGGVAVAATAAYLLTRAL